MKVIVVPTDFSKNANAAVDFAVTIANKMKLKLILVNTYELSMRAGMMMSVTKLIEEDTQKALDLTKDRIRPDLNESLAIDTHVFRGTPSRTICELAKSENAAFIIMGTKGEHDMPDYILGSTSSNVIKSSKVPVIVVPEGANTSKMEHLAYATDMQSADGRVYDYLSEIGELLDSTQISYVTVLESNEEEPDNTEVNDDRFIVVRSESVERGLLDFIKDREVDVLAMYRQNRGFWERLFHHSVTKGMALRSEIPLLVFQEQDN